MRLNKYIAHHTKYSRREADKLIENKDITLYKQILDDFSFEVENDDPIYLKGKLIKKRTEVTIIVYNKPKGTLVTKKDDRGRTTIYHKISGKFKHFIPIGRLDYASEGLLLLTDTPEIATALMESKLDRTYNLKIDKVITPDMMEAMKEGLVLDDARAGAHEKSKIYSMEFAPFAHFEVRAEGKNFSKLRVTITEGKNRELRRFFAHFEAKILDLKRISFGGINLNNLPTNKTRFFSRKEYDDVHKFMKRKKENAEIKRKNDINEHNQAQDNKKKKEREKERDKRSKPFTPKS